MSLLHDFDGLCDDEKFTGLHATEGYGSLATDLSHRREPDGSATSVTKASSILRSAPVSNFYKLYMFFLCFGLFYVGMSAVLSSMIFDLVTEQMRISVTNQSWLQGMPIGCGALGAFIVSLLTGSFGRRITVLITCGVGVLGCLLSASAGTFAQLLIGRSIAGVVVGAHLVNITPYLSEISPRARRAFTVCTGHASLVLGVTVMQAISALLVYGFEDKDQDAVWRIICIMPAFPLAVMFVAFFCLPESPRHLVKKGEPGEARLVLNRLYDGPDKLAVANADLMEIVEEIRENARQGVQEYELTHQWKMIRIILNDRTRRSFFISIMIFFLIPLTGIEIFNAYGVQIASAFGLAERTAYFGVMVGTALTNLFCLLPLMFADTYGRRSFLLSSITAMSLLNMILAFAFLTFHLSSPTHNIGGSPILFNRPHKQVEDTICNVQSSCMTCVNNKDCGYCNSVLRGSLSHCSRLLDKDFSMDGPCSVNNTHYNLITEELDCVGNEFTFYMWTPIILMSSINFAFCLGMSSMPQVLVSEMHPSWARTEVMAAAIIMYMLVAGVFNALFLPLIGYINDWGVFLVFGGVSFMSIWLFNGLIPETGVYDTLEAAAQVFADEERVGDANSLQMFRN